MNRLVRTILLISNSTAEDFYGYGMGNRGYRDIKYYFIIDDKFESNL